MSAFDFIVSLLSRLQTEVHEMPLLFAAFATIVSVIFYYRGQTRKVISMACFFGLRLSATKHSLNISLLLHRIYPFSRILEPSNFLQMPGV